GVSEGVLSALSRVSSILPAMGDGAVSKLEERQQPGGILRNVIARGARPNDRGGGDEVRGSHRGGSWRSGNLRRRREETRFPADACDGGGLRRAGQLRRRGRP